jgi:hypothetical protein
MKKLWLLVVLVLILMAQAVWSAPLKPSDFRKAVPSRARTSYVRAADVYHGSWMKLYRDRHDTGYEIDGYLLTRNLVRRQVQATIDEYNITDDVRIQELIDRYAAITPGEREVRIALFFKGPHMYSRWFTEYMADLDQKMFLQFGSKGEQSHLDKVLDTSEKHYDMIDPQDLVYKSGRYESVLSTSEAYLWSAKLATVDGPKYDASTRSFKWVLGYTFSDGDVAKIKDLMQNDQPVYLALVSADPHLSVVKEFTGRTRDLLLFGVEPTLMQIAAEKRVKNIYHNTRDVYENRHFLPTADQ